MCSIMSLEGSPSQLNHIEKRRKLTHKPINNWSFNKDLNATSEILADIGVTLLEDDDDDSQSGALECLGPTPPCGAPTTLNSPPKVKHHGHDCRKNKVTTQDSTPFLLNRRIRTELWTLHDKFSRFSDEIMLQIFKWLPKSTLKHTAQVCKRWKRLSYDESLWKRLDLGGRNLKVSTFGYVIQRGVVILRLARADIIDQVDTHPSSSDQLLNGQRYCKLQYLDLSMAAISQANLEDILSVCNKLHNLSLEHCELNDTICSYIGTNTDMEVLNLAMCSGLSQAGLSIILTKCQRLVQLNLAWASLSKSMVETVTCTLPHNVRRLNLSGCRYTLCDDYVKNLVKRCPNMEELDVSDAIQITQETLINICEYLENVRALAFSRCYNISRECYVYLNDLLHLVKLDVFGLFENKELEFLQKSLIQVQINKNPLSTIARPTTGIHRTSIWGLRVRE